MIKEITATTKPVTYIQIASVFYDFVEITNSWAFLQELGNETIDLHRANHLLTMQTKKVKQKLSELYVCYLNEKLGQSVDYNKVKTAIADVVLSVVTYNTILNRKQNIRLYGKPLCLDFNVFAKRLWGVWLDVKNDSTFDFYDVDNDISKCYVGAMSLQNFDNPMFEYYYFIAFVARFCKILITESLLDLLETRLKQVKCYNFKSVFERC